jgi:5-methylcytosine-specific restriction endonuclease McrA
VYWLLSISVPKKSIHVGYNSAFSLQSTNQISGFKISCMPAYFLILERIYEVASTGLSFKDGDQVEVDHLIPVSLGGTDLYVNLQLLHRHCHD